MTDTASGLSDVRAAGTTILDAARGITDRTALLEYLTELSSVSSAIRYGLRNAAWSGELSPGGSLEERPPLAEVERRLERGDLDREGATPGTAAFTQSIASAIAIADALTQQLSAAWTAGITENVRAEVEEARKQRETKSAQQYRELLNGVLGALKDNVPEESLGRTAQAIQKELETIKKRWNGDGKA
ncbi:hypothetical protein [Streptomyces achromogenes]|uniref:hypothetical protein n=1 Tax=Streptomyces achromogenes TaxID=67255 RepID=UPI003A80BB7D